jgi:peptidoglycan-associated lipoprotein
MNKYWVIVASSMVLAACASTPKDNSAAASNGTSQASVVPQGNVNDTSSKNLAQNAESVYFDFDQSDVKPQFKQELRQQAEWVKSHKKDSVTLEGNADERGSDEYNLALGSRRAVAVRKSLIALGVPGQRIKDVSFGKEKPKATCHEEKCWAENRRVDFVHKQS